LEKVLNPQFAKYQEEFINELRNKGRSESTIIAYAKDIEQLLNFFSSRGINKLQDTTIVDLEHIRNTYRTTTILPRVF
jgi:site-specific recombinase XerD